MKLNLIFGCADHVKPATDNQLKELGFVKGYIGPYNLSAKVKIIFDKEVNLEGAYSTGANKVDTHYVGFVPKRDLESIESVDLRLSKTGDIHRDGDKEGEVQEISGIEVGHVFQLGDKYTKSMNATVLDANGKAVNPFMGCYGIGTTRTVAAAIEQSHDEDGIIWPVSIAPYHVHFATITKTPEYEKLGDEVYDLLKKDFEVLYDDRPKLGPGFKFKDADLLGLPIRVVLGERDHKNDSLFEVKVRKTKETFKVSKEELVSKIKELLEGLS